MCGARGSFHRKYHDRSHRTADVHRKHDTITCKRMAVLSVASTTACFVAVLCKGTSKGYLLRLSTLWCSL